MWRYLFLLFSFTCLFTENQTQPTVFKTDQNKNLIVENKIENQQQKPQNQPQQKQQLTDQIARPADQSIAQTLEEEVTQDYKPMEFKWAFLKMFFWLVVLVGFFFLTLYMFKKLSHSRLDTINQHKIIKVLEKRALSPKTVLYLVEYENKKVLIGESQNELKIQLLDSEIKKS